MEPILRVENLTHTYSAGTPFQRSAVDGMNLTVMPGEFLGIIGHTGSGKSTLIQHLNGLLKPTEGHVYLNGQDIWANPKEIRKVRFQVGLVFQYPEYQLFEETVQRDVAYGVKNMGMGEKEALERADEAMALVGLDPVKFRDKSPFELSGGEKRRAALAGIIVMRPKYLVLDEPMAGLDPLGRHAILDTIDSLRETLGCAVVMVSHSMDDMADRAERIAVLAKGRLIRVGTTAEVFGDAKTLIDNGLDVPQVSRLALMLRERGVDVPSTIFDMDEMELALLRLLGKGGEKK